MSQYIHQCSTCTIPLFVSCSMLSCITINIKSSLIYNAFLKYVIPCFYNMLLCTFVIGNTKNFSVLLTKKCFLILIYTTVVYST